MSAATDIRTATANVNAAAQQLSTDVATLTDAAAALVAAGGAIRDHVSVVIAGVRAELAAAVDAAGSHVTELAAQADAARSNLAGQDRDRTARVDSARRQTSADVTAKAQAAQATLHGALTDAQNKARQASDAYVQLLALAQLGLTNQLPAGDATGATVQAGSYVYRISGTN